MLTSSKCKAIFIGLICFVWLDLAMAADVAKIGVVDIQRIMSTSEQGKASKAQIKEKSDKMTTALKDKGAEIEELKKQLERESMVMGNIPIPFTECPQGVHGPSFRSRPALKCLCVPGGLSIVGNERRSPRHTDMVRKL